MAEMIHADAVMREERHAEFRIKLGTRAADLFNAYVQDCVAKDVDLDEIDAQLLWNAALATARQELQPSFTVLPQAWRPNPWAMALSRAVLEPEWMPRGDRRALPDYQRPQ